MSQFFNLFQLFRGTIPEGYSQNAKDLYLINVSKEGAVNELKFQIKKDH